MKLHSLCALGALVFSVAAGCGGGGVSIDDLGPTLVDALCQRQVRCGVYATVEACKADVRIQIEEIQASVEAGRTKYDEGKAEDCIDGLGSASCDASSEDSRETPQACDDTFQGTVADGGACFNDEECLSEECDIPDCGMACCTGACAPTVAEVAVGGACGSTTGPCARGSFCDGTTMVCTALLGAGGACTGNSQCGYGMYCAEVGGCTDAPNHGEACPDGLCAEIGDRCDPTSMNCVSLSKRGEPCQTGFAGLFDCQQPLTCNQTTLVCEDPPTAGQACLFFCAAGNFCNDSDVCEATKANGAACLSDSECQSSFCDANDTCAVEPVCPAT
jgi:hypothetical protein